MVYNYNPTLRLNKGSELTWAELDANFVAVDVIIDDIDARLVIVEASSLPIGTANGDSIIWSTSANTWVTSNTFLHTTGGSMTGSLVLAANPVLNLEAATKQYVDTAISSFGSVKTVNGLLPDVNGNVSVALTETQTGTLANRPTTANAGVVYVVSGDTATNNGKTYIYVPGSGWEEVSSIDQASMDARYINVAGDTMTGALTLAADPTSALQAATKQYVDSSNKFTASGLFNTSTETLTFTHNTGTSYNVSLANSWIKKPATAVTNDILLFDGTNWIASAYSADLHTVSSSFDNTTGVITFTRNNASTYTVDIDGRYVNIAGDVMTGVLELSSDPTANLHAATKQYVDNAIISAGQYNTAAFNIDLASSSIDALSDVVTTGVTTGQVLTWDGLVWSPSTITIPVDVHTTSASFDITTGVLTQTRTDASTYVVDLDGRYVQTVNAIAPNANGNVSISITETQTGTLLNRPTTANNGVVYVVSGDTTGNGKTFIYVTASNSWQEVVSFDTAAADARYVNVVGDTMTGALTLPADPTSALQAATKQYVDNKKLDDLLDVTAPTPTTGQALIWNGTAWVPATFSFKLDDLTDVTAPTPATGNLLGWNGTAWVPAPYPTGDALFKDWGSISGPLNIPYDGARSNKITLSGAVTLTLTSPPNIVYEIAYTFRVFGNGSTLTWPASVKWIGTTPPSIPTSGKTSMYVISTVNAGGSWEGNYVGAY